MWTFHLREWSCTRKKLPNNKDAMQGGLPLPLWHNRSRTGQLVIRASGLDVFGRIGAFFCSDQGFFSKTPRIDRAFFAKTPRIELVLNPGPQLMVSWRASLPKITQPVAKKNRAQIDSYVRWFTSGRPTGRPTGRESGSGLLSHARPIHTGHPGSFPSLADVLLISISFRLYVSYVSDQTDNFFIKLFTSFL